MIDRKYQSNRDYRFNRDNRFILYNLRKEDFGENRDNR